VGLTFTRGERGGGENCPKEEESKIKVWDVDSLHGNTLLHLEEGFVGRGSRFCWLGRT